MKLTHYQFEQHLAKKKLHPIYLFSGDDPLLKQDASHALRQMATEQGFSERVRLNPDSSSAWEQLHLALYATSMLADQRLIELDLREHSPSKTAATTLVAYAKKPAPGQLLVIDMGKADSKIQKSDWYRAVEAAGIVVTLWPIPREQMPSWLIKRARQQQLRLQTDAAQLLSDFVEGNLVAAAQTLEKLALLQPAGTIDTQLMQTVLNDDSRFTVFDFVDSLLSPDAARRLHILQSLREDGVEPVLILWGISREWRLLAQMALQHQQGIRFEVLCQQHRIFARRQGLVQRFLRSHTATNCSDMLGHCMVIDQIIKGARPGDPWEALALFCLRC